MPKINYKNLGSSPYHRLSPFKKKKTIPLASKGHDVRGGRGGDLEAAGHLLVAHRGLHRLHAVESGDDHRRGKATRLALASCFCFFFF